MNRIRKAREELDIAEITAQIKCIESPSLYDRFLVGVQRTIAAVGGRTYLLIFNSVSLCAIVSMSFYYFRFESYLFLLIPISAIVITSSLWTFRNKLKSISGGGMSLELDTEDDVELLAPRKSPRRQKIGTLAGVDLSEINSSEVFEESEASLENSK